MSDRMSLQHAQDMATGYGAYMVNEVRASRTIVAVGRVADLLDQMADDNGRLADMTGSESSIEYVKGKHDAYAKAAEIIRDALGDTDE